VRALLPHPPVAALAPGRRRHLTAAAAAAAAATPPAPATGLKLFGGSGGGGGGKAARAQQTVLELAGSAKGRGKSGVSAEQQAAFDAAVAVLEASGGVRAPAASPLLEGRWRLVYTTRPGSASPIQRTFTGVESFSVFQEIDLSGPSPRVNNIVDFGAAVGFLKVEAEASTERRPIPGFVPRRGAGLPFGLLGTSSSEPPAAPDMRVDFAFDRAAFYFRALPVTLPYPVPFKLLGDERKGWLDTTFLSSDGRFRLSRGNKGTLFVLVRAEPPKKALLDAVAAGAPEAAIEALAEAVAAGGGGAPAPARSPLAAGAWRLLWTKQGAGANPFQRLLAGQVENYQIIGDGGASLENRVQLAPGVRVRALADAAPDSATRTGVDITRVVLELGPWSFELPIKADARGFVDWLYLDDGLRITRGSKGSLFLHTRG
jgi:hypothetical protein